jgi:hypothetical protein
MSEFVASAAGCVPGGPELSTAIIRSGAEVHVRGVDGIVESWCERETASISASAIEDERIEGCEEHECKSERQCTVPV